MSENRQDDANASSVDPADVPSEADPGVITDAAASAAVTASPYLVVKGLDGARSWTNPGITTEGPPEHFEIADDEPAVYDDIVEYALASHSYAGG